MCYSTSCDPGGKKILTPAFHAFPSALSRFFVRWCWHLSKWVVNLAMYPCSITRVFSRCVFERFPRGQSCQPGMFSSPSRIQTPSASGWPTILRWGRFDQVLRLFRALQRICFQKIRDYYGSGLTWNFFFGKSSENCTKPVVIFWSSVFCLYMHC